MAELVPSETSVSDEDELDPGEESEPEFKDNFEITIDEGNRERWPDIVLQARRHMRCHPYHWQRHRRPGITCFLRESPSSSEGSDEDNNNNNNNNAHPSTPVEPARPRFHLFTRLPKELRNHILLTTVDPVTVEGDVRIDLEWRRGPQAHFRQHLIRSFAAIPLYAVSRETRALATASFGAPDPRTFPLSPARDAVGLVWDGSTSAKTWRTTGDDHREAGPVVSAARRGCPSREWAMPRSLCQRVRRVVVDGRHARFDDGGKGPWGLVFGLVRDYFAEVGVLRLRMWDLDDEGFEGTRGAGPEEALYRVDQMDFFDRLEEASGDGRTVPFPMLRTLRIVPELDFRRKRRMLFRKVRGSHFLVARDDETPTAGP
ncbi:hypothetical protein CH35J_004662 [Colletotrichum higginsianum]|uniref:2EXR domain-containing protein n=1 Tax=Colletotrichum higginsianum TaxID=80884 RepID=A0A4T0W8Y7_9PEZI|nr:hypothetical protein CH35J_004662 [Colletotrichum higginsianum]